MIAEILIWIFIIVIAVCCAALAMSFKSVRNGLDKMMKKLFNERRNV